MGARRARREASPCGALRAYGAAHAARAAVGVIDARIDAPHCGAVHLWHWADARSVAAPRAGDACVTAAAAVLRV